ncbi:hypothetical protein AB6W40_002783 [Salmonella enterica]
MKFLVAIDSSASFIYDYQWDYIKNVVNETVQSLSSQGEVQLAKIGLELNLCTLEEFNNGWSTTDGAGIDEDKLLEVIDEYNSVLLVTDGFVDTKALKSKVSLMILEYPDYVENPLPIVGFKCNNCGHEKNEHRAKTFDCPVKERYNAVTFSDKTKFTPDMSKPIRRRTI